MSVGEALLAAVKPRLIALPATLVCLCCLAGVCAVSCNDTGCSTADSSFASNGRLRFSSDGTFRILQVIEGLLSLVSGTSPCHIREDSSSGWVRAREADAIGHPALRNPHPLPLMML